MPADEFIFSTTSVGRLGIGLFQTIRAHNLAIWRDKALIDELLSVKLVERTPGNYRLDHSASAHDDMAVCLAMGVVALLEQPARPTRGAYFFTDDDRTTDALGRPFIPLVPGHGFAGSVAMPSTVIVDDEDADEKPNGQTAVSPFR